MTNLIKKIKAFFNFEEKRCINHNTLCFEKAVKCKNYSRANKYLKKGIYKNQLEYLISILIRHKTESWEEEEYNLLQLLIDNEIGFESRGSSLYETLLMEACSITNLKIVTMLLETNAVKKTINIVDDAWWYGYNALDFAIRRDDKEMIDLLLKHGIKVTTINISNAVKYSSVKTLEKLESLHPC